MDYDPRKVSIIHISKFDIRLDLMGKKIKISFRKGKPSLKNVSQTKRGGVVPHDTI